MSVLRGRPVPADGAVRDHGPTTERIDAARQRGSVPAHGGSVEVELAVALAVDPAAVAGPARDDVVGDGRRDQAHGAVFRVDAASLARDSVAPDRRRRRALKRPFATAMAPPNPHSSPTISLFSTVVFATTSSPPVDGSRLRACSPRSVFARRCALPRHRQPVERELAVDVDVEDPEEHGVRCHPLDRRAFP